MDELQGVHEASSQGVERGEALQTPASKICTACGNVLPVDHSREICYYHYGFNAIPLILKLASQVFDVPLKDLESTSRMQHIVKPRQVAMYIARLSEGRSFPELARRFSRNRSREFNHTTIMHACDTVADLMDKDWYLAAQVQTIIGALPKTKAEHEIDFSVGIGPRQTVVTEMTVTTRVVKSY